MPKTTKWESVAENLLEELLIFSNNTGMTFKKFSPVWFMSLEDYKFYYDEAIRKNQYDKAKEYIENLIYNADFYVDDHKEMLQLHDHHTLWKINLPENYFGNFEFEYNCAVQHALIEFIKKASVDGEIGYYGRSGRHVCVPLTFHNLANYSKLKEIAENLEKEVINKFNK